VAALTTTQLSVVSGGLACVVGVLAMVWWLPEFRRYALAPAAVSSGPDG
jgi:hypothetical protein